jgi:hypothetical protein
MKPKSKIPMKSLAQYAHVKFLVTLEKQAITAYKYLMLKMNKEIKDLLKVEKLAKSDDNNGLKTGWTGEVVKLEVDVDALLAPIVDKYMSGLKWILLGDYAGLEAKKVALDLGLKRRVTPGVIQASYLHSLDSHAKHYKDVTGLTPNEVPAELVKESLEQILKRVTRFVDLTLSQLKVDTLSAVEQVALTHNFDNLNATHKDAHNNLPITGQDDAIDSDVSEEFLKSRRLNSEIKRVTEKFENTFDIAVKTDMAMASGIATHQAMVEIHGKEDDKIRVVNLEMFDERVCSFCRGISRKADGTWRKYKLSDLQPSGYNFKRKRADWKISIGVQHPRCRCQTIYLPPGFDVDENGGLYKK